MGIGYRLVNVTRREQISFSKLPAVKERELAGNPAAAALVCWYLLKNSGDIVGFVSDELSEWPFDSGSLEASHQYPDVTDQVLNSLLSIGILRDNGILWQDAEEPELYYRDIRNAWMPRELL